MALLTVCIPVLGLDLQLEKNLAYYSVDSLVWMLDDLWAEKTAIQMVYLTAGLTA
jgi:hypothetical protein